MSDGLNIGEKDFDKLNQSQKLSILYCNTEELKRTLRGWKFQMKIQWWWLSALTAGIFSLLGIKSNII
ncbi:MAG: hypothetical protein ACOC5T_04240 [Elusimicrobiota bacterium]